MVVLDLTSEVRPQYHRLESYFGQPFIWCMLHNYGGTVPMYGTVQSVNEVMTLSVSQNRVVLNFGNKFAQF